MQGLPYTYRIEIAESETTITIKILSDIGGDWTIIKTESNWLLTKTIDIQTLSTVCIIPETIWKLFSKEITRMQVYEKVTISENQKLEKTAINLIAVMAWKKKLYIYYKKIYQFINNQYITYQIVKKKFK